MTRRYVDRKATPKPTAKAAPRLPRQLETAPGKRETKIAPPPSVPMLVADRSNQPRAGESFGTEFLDNVAHQMIAPLQTIQMHCQSMLDGYIPEEEMGTRLKEIIGHSRILAELSQRMRFLHELVSGKTADNETLPFRDITTFWIDSYNNYLPITRTMNVDVDIQTNKMNRLPDVLASRIAVHQVMMNLFDNAMKYGMPNNKITIRAERDGEYVVNEFVHKARIVLTADAAGKMFTRGFRAAEAKKLRASGTGIGMWISRELMRSLRGDLRAVPTDGEGLTRFRLIWRINS